MYEKLDKLRDEVKHCEKRVAEAQSRLKAAQEKLKEGEASQILSDVGALKMPPEELAKVLELVKSGQLNQEAAVNTNTGTQPIYFEALMNSNERTAHNYSLNIPINSTSVL